MVKYEPHPLLRIVFFDSVDTLHMLVVPEVDWRCPPDFGGGKAWVEVGIVDIMSALLEEYFAH